MPEHPLRPYLSPEQRVRRMDELATRLGAELVHYGQSVQGEDLVAVRVPAAAGEVRHKVLCSANIHGPEFISGMVSFGLLEALLTDPDRFATLRAHTELWVVPCLNPDGYRTTWSRAGSGPLHLLRTNANGVDLNRNFPLPRGKPTRMLPGAGSSVPGAATFRGTAPLSEPETHALDQLMQAQNFHASINGHSFMGTVIPARVTDRPSFRTYKQLAQTIACAQPNCSYWRLSHRIFDVFTGEQEDHQHHQHGCWAVCLETFSFGASFRQHLRRPDTFWRFNPHDPQSWVANDVAAVVAFVSAATALPRPQNRIQADT